ncbi:MAG: HdaA/DnaA family protein, partial [Boseongicola sp.]
IDNADQTTGIPEESLLHLHNHMAHTGLALLLTAQTPPSRWEFELPDLASRMQASDVVKIDPPDDALLAAMLVKLFEDRQLGVSPELIQWLVNRCERSFASIQSVVAALDTAALSEKRAITRQLAADVLDKLGQDAQ